MSFDEICAQAQAKLEKNDAAGALEALETLDVLRLTQAQQTCAAALFGSIPQELRERSSRHCIQAALLAREMGDETAFYHWQHSLTALRDKKKTDEPELARIEYYLGCAALVRPATDNAQLLMTLAILYNDTQEKKIEPFLSATGKRPGVLRGAKDLSHWGRNYRAVASILQPMLGAVLPYDGQGAAQAASAELLYEKNDINGATLYLPAATASEDPEIQFAGLAVLARICRLDRQARSPEEVLRQMGEAIRQSKAEWLLPNYEALCVQFDICAGRVGAVQEWLDAQPADEPGSCGNKCGRYRMMVRAQAMLSLGRNREAALLTEELLLSMQNVFSPLDRIECLLDGALACERIGSRHDAQKKLTQALELAREYGYVRVFADRGRPMLAMLTAYARENPEAEKHDRFLRALTEAAKNFSICCPAVYAPVCSEETGIQLTAAEVQLLHLLAEGKNNRQMGEDLGIKLSTVKFHLHNLFEKLGVTSRTEALSAAKQRLLL